MKYTLPNGATVEGTATQIVSIARALGYTVNLGNTYQSESQGTLLIDEMQTSHIRNALLKKYRAWAQNLNTAPNNRALLNALRNGPNDKEFTDLLTAFVVRVNSGQ